jgi:anti-sigma regulatory factor (Ser/Thr protein kinase)
MTADPLRLVSSAASGVGWRWLTAAVEMAALASGNWLLAADSGVRARVATRTPGTDARSVGMSRDFTVATLRRWRVAERCEDVAVVVSELLTNALCHAVSDSAGPTPRWPIRLGLLQCGPCLLCAVADPSDKAPAPGDPGCLAESGRGLHVIDALSDQWGYTAACDMGKVVWATFSTEPAPAQPRLTLARRSLPSLPE